MNQASGAGPIGQTRNPVMVLLLSWVCAFYYIYSMWTMLNELKAYLNKSEIQPWHLFIPILNILLLWINTPKWVTEAQQKAGVANPAASGIIMYILFTPFALAGDLNKVWNPRGQLPAGAAA